MNEKDNLKCWLTYSLSERLGQIRSDRKKIEDFKALVGLVEAIMGDGDEQCLETFGGMDRDLLKAEFLEGYFSSCINEVLFHLNKRELFADAQFLAFKSKFSKLIGSTNYEDIFRVLTTFLIEKKYGMPRRSESSLESSTSPI
jgi:hypothetical protein